MPVIMNIVLTAVDRNIEIRSSVHAILAREVVESMAACPLMLLSLPDRYTLRTMADYAVCKATQKSGFSSIILSEISQQI